MRNIGFMFQRRLKNQRVFILITHSLGELDVLLPLISGLKNEYANIQVEIIIAVKRIYKQFASNHFYKTCVKELKCNISYQRLPNKFDKNFRRFKDSQFGNRALRLYFFVMSFVWFPPVIIKVIHSDICMHEFSNQIRSTWPLYWAQKVMGKKIITYSHGHSFTLDTKAARKKSHAGRSLFLLFHHNDKNFMTQLGYTKQYIIGYPKFYPEWKKILKEYTGSRFEGEQIALIYSRHIHDLYMDKGKYRDLIISTCEVIRKKMGSILIVLRPHPREDQNEIERIVKQADFDNVVVSWEHAGVLARNAKIAVSFWTSAILDSLSLGVPSVEYYKEASRFREIEPEGSAYKKLGIDSVDNRLDLELFFDKVLNNSYRLPEIINTIDNVRDVGFLETV